MKKFEHMSDVEIMIEPETISLDSIIGYGLISVDVVSQPIIAEIWDGARNRSNIYSSYDPGPN